MKKLPQVEKGSRVGKGESTRALVLGVVLGVAGTVGMVGGASASIGTPTAAISSPSAPWSEALLLAAPSQEGRAQQIASHASHESHASHYSHRSSRY